MITTCLLFVRTVLCKSCNIRIIRGMHAGQERGKGEAMGKNGGGDESQRGYTRVSSAKGRKCAGEIEGCVSVGVSERGIQSTDFSAGIVEFQWTRWPRKPIAESISPPLPPCPRVSLLLFSTLCFEKPKGRAYWSTHDTLLRLESALRQTSLPLRG